MTNLPESSGTLETKIMALVSIHKDGDECPYGYKEDEDYEE